MKKILFSLVVFLTIIGAVRAGTIEVEITGIKNNRGRIQIGLYNSEKTFPKKNMQFKGISVAAQKNSVKAIFQNIPTDRYAIAVFHDENSNQQLDTNFLGAPKEKYGFSQNIYGTFGPPKFSRVSFFITKGQKLKMKIHLEK